jgi:hypothetical protein
MKIRAYGSKSFAVINLRGVSTNKTIITEVSRMNVRKFTVSVNTVKCIIWYKVFCHKHTTSQKLIDNALLVNLILNVSHACISYTAISVN